MTVVDHRIVEITLEYVDGQNFERFVNVFYPALTGIEFIPLGGAQDGGADAFLDRDIFEGGRETFYQASVEENHRAKIRRTIRRLREFGRDPRSVTYVTPRPIKNVDKEEELLTRETNVFIKIRDRKWTVAQVHANDRTVTAFNSYLAPSASFLKSIGGSTFVRESDRIPARAVCVFLSQEIERRRRDSTLLEALTDSLILWALEETDPEKNRLMSRDEILQKIESTLPIARRFIRGVMDHRLEVMAAKHNPTGREVRWYRKQDRFCLPHETRRLAELENEEDEFLKVRVLSRFEERAQAFLEEAIEKISARDIANIALFAIELTFQKEGLELAAFLTGGEGNIYESVSDQVDEAVQSAGVKGEAALITKEIALQIIRSSFYESNEAERLLFGKFARTYALLFSMQAEPRLVEYFQGMSANFRLYVGSDLIVRALSERYLRDVDQMTVNMLRILRDAGSELIFTDPVLDEVVSHVRGTDYEFINFFRDVEPYVTNDIARHANKILIRAYFYAKDTRREQAPRGWRSFIGQMCKYEDLHRPQGRHQMKMYFVEKFGMGFESESDLARLCDEDEVRELATKLLPIKKEEILAVNDARQVLAVYGKRQALDEYGRANPYGYRTWWLTHESRVRYYTGDIVARKGAMYIMRPEFILNFIALSPTTEEVRQTYNNVFPTLLGVRLSNRMKDEVFHALMRKARELKEVDEARARVMMGGLIDKLKGDRFKQYETNFSYEWLEEY